MREGSTIAYQPALDGVRALAVAAVLLFHAEVPGFDGGYLGVSVFFTLSGYLITSLLLHEHARRGTIALGPFYARRIRRLLPASALCLGAIALLAALTDVFAGVEELRAQIVGSVLQVANWVFLAGEGSYQDLFQQTGGARSPLEHFWSLAIEEQFYWVWPPAMLLLLTRVRSPRGRLAVLGAVTAVFVVAAPVIAAVWGADAAYWATPARIAEILLGAVLAAVLAQRGPVPGRVAWAAPVGLVALAACVVLFPASSGPAYEGWLPAVAVLSVLLILGLQAPGPIQVALGTAPLVWLGKISYGVYLYHWPIYVLLDEGRTGLDGAPLVLAQLAVTLAVAQVSYTLVEQPIRGASRLPQPVTFAGGAFATVAVVVATLVVVPKPLGEYWVTDEATEAAAAIEVGPGDDVELLPAGVTPTVPPTDAPAGDTATHDTATDDSTTDDTATDETPTDDTATDETATDDTLAADTGATVPGTSSPAPVTDPVTSPVTSPTTEAPLPALARPVRIVVAGDSTARATGTGLVAWAAANPDLAQVEVVGAAGCGFLRGGEPGDDVFQEPEGCALYLDDVLPDRVAELQPDVVMMMVTTWDLLDRQWDGVRYTPLDDEYEQRLLGDYARLQNELLARGAGTVAWVRAPLPRPFWNEDGTTQEEPERHEVARQVMEGLAAADPARVRVVDLRTWFTDSGLDDDRTVRPDGVHVEPAAAADIAERFLGERLVRVAVGL